MVDDGDRLTELDELEVQRLPLAEGKDLLLVGRVDIRIRVLRLGDDALQPAAEGVELLAGMGRGVLQRGREPAAKGLEGVQWAVTKRYMSAETLKTPRTDGPSEHDPRPCLDAANNATLEAVTID